MMVTGTAPGNVAGLETAEPPAIEIHDLVVAYGARRAVDGLSLRVPAGSVFGFLGPNGSGKTTTIKALLGFRRPVAGRARVLGYDVLVDSLAIRARVGFVSEVNSLYDYLTIPQMVALCRSLGPRWNGSIVDRYIGVFDLPPRAKIGRLSKGMKAQLALCLALGSEPDLLILDEPTNGLDPLARREFLTTIVREVAAQGRTVFFSSHILSEVEEVADWIAIIRDGKLLVSDELDHLKQTEHVLKLTYADVPPAADLVALRAMPGVVRLAQEGRGVRLVLRGDAGALAAQIRARSTALRDLEVVPLNLEALFLEYMKDGRHDR